MSKCDDLLKDGIVTQDPDNEDRVVFTVPFYLKKVAVDADGFEAFASQYGWNPIVMTLDGTEIPNPQTAPQKVVAVLYDFARQVFESSIIKNAEAQARAQAQVLIDQLKS